MKRTKMNIVDIAVILVIVLAVGIGVYKFAVVNKVHATGVTSEAADGEFIGCLFGVRQPTIDALHVGDKVYDEKTNTYLGEITKIDVTPHITDEIGLDGAYIQAEKLDYFNVTMTIRGPILEKDTGYYASGVFELKTNSEFPVYTKFVKPTLRILDISLSGDGTRSKR